MRRALSRHLVGVERWLPSALVVAVVLTGIVGVLAFMTQMALILLLGYTPANTRPVRRLLVHLGSLPRTPTPG